MSKHMICAEDEPSYPAVRAPRRCKKFYCRGCLLWQPYCSGAYDDAPELCDNCAAKARPR